MLVVGTTMHPTQQSILLCLGVEMPLEPAAVPRISGVTLASMQGLTTARLSNSNFGTLQPRGRRQEHWMLRCNKRGEISREGDTHCRSPYLRSVVHDEGGHGIRSRKRDEI